MPRLHAAPREFDDIMNNARRKWGKRKWIYVQRRYCSWRLGQLRCIHGAKCFSITHDGSKCHGHIFETAGMLRTSERLCKCKNTCGNERCTWNASNSGTRFANDLDTATTIKTQEKLGFYWRPSRPMRKQSLKSFIGGNVLGTNIWEYFAGTWSRKRTRMGVRICSPQIWVVIERRR